VDIDIVLTRYCMKKIILLILGIIIMPRIYGFEFLKNVEKVRKEIASTVLFVARSTPAAEAALSRYVPKREVQISEKELPLIPVDLAYIDRLSIMPENTWLTLTMDDQGVHPFHLPESNQYQRGIKQLMFYKPELINPDKKPIVILLTHGTFARENNDFAQEEHLFFRGVKRYAQVESIRQKAPVLLVTYQWEGNNSSPHRVGAGTYLANIMNTYFNNHHTILISHSHGGNVVNYATRLVEKPVDLIVHIATPSRDEERFKPVNFKKLLSFYSIADAVQIGGAVRAHKEIVTGPLWASLLFTPIPINSQRFERSLGNVYNIRTQINGDDPGHSNLKVVPWFLQPIQELVNVYEANHDLNLNVDLATGDIILSINQQEATSPEEERFSDTMKELFAQKHQRAMDQKGSIKELGIRALSLITKKEKLIDPETGQIGQ
jgi:hypothetical protein